MIDPRVDKLAREIIGKVDMGTINLTYLEKALSAFAEELSKRL